MDVIQVMRCSKCK